MGTRERQAGARGLLMGTLALFTNAACGRTIELSSVDAGASASGGRHDASPYDASHDASSAPSSSIADSGPSFHDVGNEDADVCEVPESICIDASTLRVWRPVIDGGACAFEPFDVTCDPSWVAPDCFQGGCRLVLVR